MTAHGHCYRCGNQAGVYDSEKKRWDCGCSTATKHNEERKPAKGQTIHVRDVRAKRSALIQDAKYGPCGCESGKKAKFCCWDELVRKARAK